jgi:phospholipid N-methyltransferase
MPTSYNFYKDLIKDWILENISTDLKILDVGPGVGTYSDLIRTHGYKMDAVEIWQPYIDDYELNTKYDNVYNDNILSKDAEFIEQYDFVIIGDVLEHLSVEDAQKLMRLLQLKNKKYLIAVPYSLEQGECEGNVYETHLQPDLTPELVLERYPELQFFCGNELYGYYINK